LRITSNRVDPRANVVVGAPDVQHRDITLDLRRIAQIEADIERIGAYLGLPISCDLPK